MSRRYIMFYMKLNIFCSSSCLIRFNYQKGVKLFILSNKSLAFLPLMTKYLVAIAKPIATQLLRMCLRNNNTRNILRRRSWIWFSNINLDCGYLSLLFLIFKCWFYFMSSSSIIKMTIQLSLSSPRAWIHGPRPSNSLTILLLSWGIPFFAPLER